jgi:hypothetical protein
MAEGVVSRLRGNFILKKLNVMETKMSRTAEMKDSVVRVELRGSTA